MSVTNDIKWEAAKVKELGEQIGYGNMMELASALWRKKLKAFGGPETGAFVPTLIQDLNGEAKRIAVKSSKHHDELVKDI